MYNGTPSYLFNSLEYQAQFSNNLFFRKTVMFFRGLNLYFKKQKYINSTCNHRSNNVKIENKITNEIYSLELKNAQTLVSYTVKKENGIKPQFTANRSDQCVRPASGRFGVRFQAATDLSR